MLQVLSEVPEENSVEILKLRLNVRKHFTMRVTGQGAQKLRCLHQWRYLKPDWARY